MQGWKASYVLPNGMAETTTFYPVVECQSAETLAEDLRAYGCKSVKVDLRPRIRVSKGFLVTHNIGGKAWMT